MITVTLAQYTQQGGGASWAQPDCDHQPGMWRRDLRYSLTIPARYVTKCQVCGAMMQGEGTEFGKITKVLK